MAHNERVTDDLPGVIIWGPFIAPGGLYSALQCFLNILQCLGDDFFSAFVNGKHQGRFSKSCILSDYIHGSRVVLFSLFDSEIIFLKFTLDIQWNAIFFPPTSMEEFSFFWELLFCPSVFRCRGGRSSVVSSAWMWLLIHLHLKVKINVSHSDWSYPRCREGDFPSTNQQNASFPHGMKLDVFVRTEIPRDQLSFRVVHMYKGVGNYKYRAVINRMDSLRAGWITEDICESVCLCIPWALVSVPMTCPASFLPSLCPCVYPFLRSVAGLIEQKPAWHGKVTGRLTFTTWQPLLQEVQENTFNQALDWSTFSEFWIFPPSFLFLHFCVAF